MQTLQFCIQSIAKNNRDTYSIPHLARFITLYEPNNENVVPAFLCGSKYDCVVEVTLTIFAFISYICSVSCLEFCIALSNYCKFLCLACNFVFKCKGIRNASFLRHWPDLLNT